MDLENIDTAHSALRLRERPMHARSLPTCCTPLRWRAAWPAAGVTANCLHPGIVATNLLPRWLRVVQRLMTRVTFDAVRGARTTLYSGAGEGGGAHQAAATSTSINASNRPRALANDPALQELLWTASARWTLLDARDAAPLPTRAGSENA